MAIKDDLIDVIDAHHARLLAIAPGYARVRHYAPAYAIGLPPGRYSVDHRAGIDELLRRRESPQSPGPVITDVLPDAPVIAEAVCSRDAIARVRIPADAALVWLHARGVWIAAHQIADASSAEDMRVWARSYPLDYVLADVARHESPTISLRVIQRDNARALWFAAPGVDWWVGDMCSFIPAIRRQNATD